MLTVEDILSKTTLNKETGCLEWTGATRSGYGVVKVGRTNHNAHRMMWILLNGSLEKDQFVCHHCDNRLCVNPNHLFVGTQSDNMLDAYRKGRIKVPLAPIDKQFKPGEAHLNSKLTEAQAIEIKQRIKNGECQRTIAKDYPISYYMVNKIARGYCWKHLP